MGGRWCEKRDVGVVRARGYLGAQSITQTYHPIIGAEAPHQCHHRVLRCTLGSLRHWGIGAESELGPQRAAVAGL